MIDHALYLYGRPADATKMASVLEQHPGPYRALSAYKGDEERGDRSWPWIVVGASRVNVFGRLWSRLATGMRREETFALRWTDIDLQRGTATTTTKGGYPKTTLLEGDALTVLALCPRTGDLVFSRRNWRKIFDAALKRAGITDFHWHDLRHTHATWLRQRAAKLDVVQRSLGHASVTTTQRYAHVDDGELRAALRGLPAFDTSTANVVRLKR